MLRTKQALATVRTNPAAVADVYEAICRDIVEQVGATRASVWTFNTLKDAITSECLLDTRDGSVSRGVTLKEEDFGSYFHAIRNDLKIVAPDALTHPATSCFDEIYFTPLDIRSLLDYVVLVRDEPTMVLCCEHCGEQKAWSDEDIRYLHHMAAALALAAKSVVRQAA